MNRTAKSRSSRQKGREVDSLCGKLRDVMVIANREGLLAGTRTRLIRGRMPEPLVKRAKLRSGIGSDTALMQAALASIAVGDDYADWLLSRRGVVSPKISLE